MGLTVAIPGGGAVAADFAGRDLGFEHGKCLFDSAVKLRPWPFLQLGLRIVQVVNIDARQAQIAQAPLDLVVEVARRDTVPLDDLVRTRQAGLDESAVDVSARIRWHLTVKGQIPPFSRDHDLLALHPAFLVERSQDLTNPPLAALVAVVNRGIQHVTAAL